MRILHLTLYRKWFDLIASGEKVVEYREDSDYWHKRIFNDDGWDEIHFRNGFGSHRPLMVVEFLFAFVTHSSLCACANGEELSGRVIVITLGNRVRFENYEIDKRRMCGGCGALINEENSLCDACAKRIDAGVVPWSKEVHV